MGHEDIERRMLETALKYHRGLIQNSQEIVDFILNRLAAKDKENPSAISQAMKEYHERDKPNKPVRKVIREARKIKAAITEQEKAIHQIDPAAASPDLVNELRKVIQEKIAPRTGHQKKMENRLDGIGVQDSTGAAYAHTVTT